jgi:hypothetical protein
MRVTKNVSNVFGLSVILLLLISTVSGVSMSINKSTVTISNTSNLYPQTFDEYTHTSFVEACTASWCSPCATAAAIMNDIFYSGDYDFYYVSLVSDKNIYANARCSELNVSYIPDYVFDGGFTRYVGSAGLPNAYKSRLYSCGTRIFAEIDLDLNVIWNGDAELDINLNITNNEGVTYEGHLHVCVTEIESRWNTNSGQPYHFAMVGDYAFNENVNILGESTTEYSTIWDGSQYGISDLEEDNVMVIAAVYNSYNNYVDETTAVYFSELWPPGLEVEIKSGFSSISANIKNNGVEDIADIDWSIYVNGGILKLINVSSDGFIKNLAVDNETTIKTDEPVFGFGRVTIAVNIKIGTRTKQGFALGPFLFII